ncbi:MAG: hypothetical protein LBM04_05685 [Opitutaceae bacterium]|nr:hypothetical protein [Opitutaceae bacterium]
MRHIARRRVEPPAKTRMPCKTPCLFRRQHKHRLRDILRRMRITAHLPECGRVHKTDAPFHESGKSRFRAGLGIAAQQFGVIHHVLFH